MYRLDVKFVSGSQLPLTEHNSHEEAWESAKAFFRFRASSPEHEAVSYSLQRTTDPNSFAIIRTDTRNRYKPSGTYAFLMIREVPGGRSPEEDLVDRIIARLLDRGIISLPEVKA